MVTDPDRNRPLARVIKEARTMGLSNATIEAAIKRSKVNTDSQENFAFYGPGRVAFIVEMVGVNKGDMGTKLRTVLKKCAGGANFDHTVANMFDRRGIVFARRKSDAAGGVGGVEAAEDDAIEVGAEEVGDEGDVFAFYCDPNHVSAVNDGLAAKYDVDSCGVHYVPNVTLELTKAEKAPVRLLIKALDEHPNVLAVHHNLVL